MITEASELARRAVAALQSAGFYWREVDGVRGLICAPLEQAGFANAFSTRLGGVSPLPHDSLNLAGFNEDDAENIYENRRRFLKLFANDWTLTGCWQIHSGDVRVVRRDEDAKPKSGVLGDDQYCDALVSNLPKVLLGVKTADCVPILLGDPETGAYAAVHSGWKGTSVSIVVNAIRQLEREYGTQAANLYAAIGPAANACCYEVGNDVINLFKERFAHADRLLTPTREGHAHINLQEANHFLLVSAGVSSERIQIAPLCTMDRNDLFFSYRREKEARGRVGRLMSVIGRA